MLRPAVEIISRLVPAALGLALMSGPARAEDVARAAGTNEAGPGIVAFAQLPNDLFRRAMDRIGKLISEEEKNPLGVRAIRNERAPLVVAPTPEVKPSAAWVRTLTSLEADVEVSLNFIYKGDPSYEGPEQPFDMLVRIEPGKVFMKHSMVRKSQFLSGLQSSFQQAGFTRLFYEGRGKTSLLVLVPDFYAGGARVVFLCPRTISPSVGFLDSGYRIAGGAFKGKALADATFAPERGASTVRATINVSPGMKPLPQYKQEMRREGAVTAKVHYDGEAFGGSAESPMLAAAHPFKLLGGISPSVDYEVAADKQLTVATTTTMEIREVDMPFKVKIAYEGRNEVVVPGMCYAVAKLSWSGGPLDPPKSLP